MSGKIISTSRKISDPIDIAKLTLRVKEGKSVSFTLTGGKGTSAQPISFENLSGIISALKHYNERGIPIRKKNSSMTELEFLHASIEEVDGIVEFRTYGGRGAKPTRFPKDRFDDVISFLQNEATNTMNNYLNNDDSQSDVTTTRDEISSSDGMARLHETSECSLGISDDISHIFDKNQD